MVITRHLNIPVLVVGPASRHGLIAGIKPSRSIAMTCDDSNLIGIVEGEMRMNENEDIG